MHMQERDRVRDGGERGLELKEKSFDVVAIKKNIGPPPHLGKGTFFCDLTLCSLGVMKWNLRTVGIRF